MKKHSMKPEDVVEPVGLKDGEEDNTIGAFGYIEPEYLTVNADFYGKPWGKVILLHWIFFEIKKS